MRLWSMYRPMTKAMRLLTVFSMIAMVFVSGVLGPAAMAPTVVAAEEVETCTDTDEFFWVLSLGLVNDHCDPSELSQEANDIIETQESLTEGDLYNGGIDALASLDTTKQTLKTYGEDSRTPAFLKGQNATFIAMGNGESGATLNQTAEDAVEDYYTASQELRWVRAHEKFFRTIGRAAERQVNQSLGEVVEVLSQNTYEDPIHKVEKVTKNYTLINGTQVQYTGYILTYNDFDEPYEVDLFIDGHNDGQQLSAVSSSSTSNDVRVALKDPSTGDRTYLQHGDREWGDVAYSHTDLSDLSQQVEANAVQFAHTADSDPNVDPTNHTDPMLMAQEWATDYNDTGYYAYAIAALGHLGMGTPANTTGSMEIFDYERNTTINGILFSPTAPNGSWETGVVYNASTITGQQKIVMEDGQIIELNGEFEIERMVDYEGNEHQSTEVVRYTYETVDMSEYYEQQDKILEWQLQMLDELASDDTEGGGGGIPMDWVSDLVYSLTGMSLGNAEAGAVLVGGAAGLWLLAKSILMV